MTDNNDHNNSVRPNLSPSVGGALALANTRKNGPEIIQQQLKTVNTI